MPCGAPQASLNMAAARATKPTPHRAGMGDLGCARPSFYRFTHSFTNIARLQLAGGVGLAGAVGFGLTISSFERCFDLRRMRCASCHGGTQRLLPKRFLLAKALALLAQRPHAIHVLVALAEALPASSTRI